KGKHNGLMYYTIGQRQGLGIGGAGEPWFVTGKNLQENILYVGQGYNHEALLSDGLIGTDMNWINGKPDADKFTCTAKFRYRQKDSAVNVKILDDTNVEVTFS